jgi:DNA-binding IclR family transcriptional regulator
MSLPNDDAPKAQRAVQSIEVGGQLLLALAASRQPMLLKDLAAQAGLPSARAHPYLVSYGRLGLVRQNNADGRYALGPAALQLGLTALHQLDAMQVATPVADALAADTAQAVAIAVWGNLGATVVRMSDAKQPLHVAMRVGTVMATFGTATGRAFAGVLRAEQVVDAMTGETLGSEGATKPIRIAGIEGPLSAARAELKQHGCTRAVGSPLPGVNAFSAPVFNHDGAPSLVLTLFGHHDLVPGSWASPMAVAVKRAAAQISAQLGYRS